MAKSIRSKAKRKLRAAKREKVAAKQRLKLLAIQEQEDGIKMNEDTVERGENDENIPALSGGGDEAMEILGEYRPQVKAKKKKLKKTSRSVNGKNIKRLKNKKNSKYKW